MHRFIGGAIIVWLYLVAFSTLYDLFGWLGVGAVIVFPFLIPMVPFYLAWHGHWWPLIGIGLSFVLYLRTEPEQLGWRRLRRPSGSMP